MNGSMKTIAAGYAVALKILRDQMKAYDPRGLRPTGDRLDVFQRYMAQNNPTG